MNIYAPSLNPVFLYYPLGNTPAVCLTQDLPPEQEADILLLGCGDVRNVLFTCFADNARKIDVTCCDIEPMIHARNVLLYTLLIDDESNHNVSSIWNIYYHWKIDENSMKLLESQADKLLQLSKSIDQWHGSIYGSFIRFCDERSLFSVRDAWLGFTTHGLSTSEKESRMNQLKTAIKRAKDCRRIPLNQINGFGYRSTFPTSTNANAWGDLRKISTEWWDSGEVTSSDFSALKPIHLNPAILYSPNYHLTMHGGTSPLGGIPLSTVYTSINKDSELYVPPKGASFSKQLVDCAKHHFSQWALAFRRSLLNGSVVRIICGDALAVCFTLRNCQLTGSTTMNLFRDNLANNPLILHHSDYGSKNNAAPLSFNVIDTSNVIDYIGPLNLIAIASSLLKPHATSCLYTELFNLVDLNVKDRLVNLFGVDVRSMALFLGLIPPDLFTNATNSIEEYPSVRKTLFKGIDGTVSARSRLRWRRSRECQASGNVPNIQVNAKELAKFLCLVYNAMFKLADDSMLERRMTDPLAFSVEVHNLHHRPYSTASFAILLSFIKSNVVSDWDKCVWETCRTIFHEDPDTIDPIKSRFKDDLVLNMHIFRVNDSVFERPGLHDIHDPILASIFPKCDSLPEQLCVTVRVSRECLKFWGNRQDGLSIICSFEAVNSSGRYVNAFSSLKIVFGKSIKRDKASSKLLQIEEDTTQLLGKSDMFVSVMVPTSMLTWMVLTFKPFVPLVKCGLKHSVWNMLHFARELTPDLFFASSKITSKDVLISEFMPGMSGLPKFVARGQQNKKVTNITVANLSDDGFKINTLVKRIVLESDAAKELAMKSSKVKVEFKSPLTFVVSIAESHKFKLEFPAPVSLSKYKIRVARTSSYVEIESCLLDPLDEDAPAFLFPSFLTKVPSGIVPVPWTSMRVNLDVMPSIDLKDLQRLSWLPAYISQMHSKRERGTNNTFRSSLKEGLKSVFMLYAGFDGSRKLCFELSDVESRSKVLILPSSLRLDLANNTIVLDCAMMQLTDAIVSDPEVISFLKKLNNIDLYSIKVKKAENLAWKAMMPALVERSRTWKHTLGCEYVQTGEVPLLADLADSKLPICSCGIGKFPIDYLNDLTKKIPTLSYVLNHYATRAAISPIFPLQYVEDCVVSNDVHYLDLTGMTGHEMCSNNCGSDKSKNTQANDQSLLRCSRCKIAKYCSTSCQKANWKEHKSICKALSQSMSSKGI